MKEISNVLGQFSKTHELNIKIMKYMNQELDVVKHMN